MPRDACVELIALCCAVCLLAVSRSDWQNGCNLGGGGNTSTERDHLKKKKKTSTRHVCLVLLYVRKKAQRSTTQHRSAGQGTAPHGAALRRCVCSWADLRWTCIVIQQRSTWYVQTWCSSTSWAGQEALIGTISQYHTHFLEFGSEILTRDFKQAEQDIQNRMQKKKK